MYQNVVQSAVHILSFDIPYFAINNYLNLNFVQERKEEEKREKKLKKKEERLKRKNNEKKEQEVGLLNICCFISLLKLKA